MMGAKREGVRVYRVPSTWGRWKIYVGDRGVRRIILPSSPPAKRNRFEWKLPPGCREKDRLIVNRLMEQLRRFFSGRCESLNVVTDIRGATVFRERVWRHLRRIPPGERVSYGELARMIGSGKAYRSVGSACAANPLPIVFPCHRVVGKRSPGGFSAGLKWKKFLLDGETGRDREIDK